MYPRLEKIVAGLEDYALCPVVSSHDDKRRALLPGHAGVQLKPKDGTRELLVSQQGRVEQPQIFVSGSFAGKRRKRHLDGAMWEDKDTDSTLRDLEVNVLPIE